MQSNARRLKTEIVHCLLLDIVGYSRRSLAQQRRMVEELRESVRTAPEFRRAEAEGELLLCDLGDGAALVFNDPLAPVQCAIEIAQALQAHSDVPVRMGIHSGLVSRGTGIADSENVYGEGINMAQRVMDCGDAGHILLSQRSADDLRQFEEWEPYLHELGEVQVKHGERLRLFNLHTGEVGNPAIPQKLRPAAHAVVTVAESVEASSPAPVSSQRRERQPKTAAKPEQVEEADRQKVALLYKRNSQPDEYMLKLLETELRAEGYDVFVDRHLTIGVEWAREIERQVCSADAVIPLLSEAATQSEMLEYELQTAHQAAQTQHNKPRLLPVRLQYTGLLPDPLAAILDPLHYTLWQGPQDDARLVAELLHALRNPPAHPPVVPLEKLESVGGAVPLESEFYIARPVDTAFLEAIARQDSIVLVKGARQMGKTSLLARGLQQARGGGARVVYTDFQTLNARHLESADALLLALATMITSKLGLNIAPRAVWDADLGASMNMEWLLENEILPAFSEPLVWGLDEVDRLFPCAFGSEIFGLFRSWHNRRALEPSGPWSRLTLAMAYATEAHLFITDLNQSPFNVGTRLAVEDFTLDQVEELNRRYGGPLRNTNELSRFYRLVSGHPYLVRRGLDEMVRHGLDSAALEAQADRDEGLFGDHLRRVLVSLSKDPELTEIVRGVLQGKACPTPESFYRLRAAGVLSGDTYRKVRPRCQLYTTYLERHLL